MLRYAVRRLLELIPTTLGILLLTFVLFNVVGGSSAQVVLGKNATKASIEAFNKRYGYDKPLILNTQNLGLSAEKVKSLFDSQFFNFIANVAKGEFGMSTEHREPVMDVLKRGVGPTLSLTVPMVVFGTLLGLALALGCAAFRGGAFDRGVLVMSTVLMSVNYVVWVLAGQFFLAYRLRLFPIWGYEGAFYLALPVLIGVLSSLGVDIRFFRTAVLDEIYKPYVRTARAKGLSGLAILVKHVLRNSLIPIVTYVSLSIPYLFTGSLLLETFFGIPGLGNVSLNAINSADLAVVRAVVLLGALLYQIVNLVTDLAYAALDPRVRLG